MQTKLTLNKNPIFTSNDSKEYKYGTVYYRNGLWDRYKINNPQGIILDLEHWKQDSQRTNLIEPIIEFIENSKVFLGEKIHGVIGFGGLTTVFDIGNNRALKISKENPFEYRKYNPKFDIPLLSPIYNSGELYGYVQALADKHTTILDVLSVKRKMKKAGYIPSCDFSNNRTDQVGRYKGQSYLLDSRCALKMNNRKTRFANWFYDNFYAGQRVFYVKKVDPTAPLTHVSETPKPNYTKQEVIAIIKKVIKSWHRYNH